MTLAEITERVPNCVVAAWIDARTGGVIEQRAVAETTRVGEVLETVIEIVRSPERPLHAVLLSREHVYITRRARAQAKRVLVVVCGRSPNLGVAIALVRALVDADAEALHS